jgi:hypothetical protein
MNSEGLEEMFEGNFANTCAEKFMLALKEGQPTGQSCADGEQGPPLENMWKKYAV